MRVCRALPEVVGQPCSGANSKFGTLQNFAAATTFTSSSTIQFFDTPPLEVAPIVIAYILLLLLYDCMRLCIEMIAVCFTTLTASHYGVLARRYYLLAALCSAPHSVVLYSKQEGHNKIAWALLLFPLSFHTMPMNEVMLKRVIRLLLDYGQYIAGNSSMLY